MAFFPVENIDDYIIANSTLREQMAEWQSENPEANVSSWFTVAVHGKSGVQELYKAIAGEIGQLYTSGLEKYGVRIGYRFTLPVGDVEVPMTITRALYFFDEAYLQPWFAKELGEDTSKYRVEDAVLLLFGWEVPEVVREIDDNFQPSASIREDEDDVTVLSAGAVMGLPKKDPEEGEPEDDYFLVQFPSNEALAHTATFIGSIQDAASEVLEVNEEVEEETEKEVENPKDE